MKTHPTSEKQPKCRHCGMIKGNHKAVTFHCPGTKSRFTWFHQTNTFEPKESRMESSVSPPKPVKTLSLYVVSRDPWDVDYDEYDGVVVAAENEAHALTFEPLPQWTKFDMKPASVQYIGTAAPDTQPGIIFKSFKAG